MPLLPSPSVEIAGQAVPRRRFTPWALAYFLGLVAAPVLGIALALDVGLFYAARHWGWGCYSALCLFG